MQIFTKRPRVILAVIMLFFFCGIVHAQPLGFEESLKIAKEQNKKVIVDVYTDWCGWCHKMDRDAYSNKDIKEMILNDFVLIKLDAESTNKINYNGKSYTGEELAAKFQASGYPTTVFLSSDGNVIEFNYDKYKMNNLPGYYNAKEFKKVLEYIRDEKFKDTDLSTIL
jgi:thioredoxin-related protein